MYACECRFPKKSGVSDPHWAIVTSKMRAAKCGCWGLNSGLLHDKWLS